MVDKKVVNLSELPKLDLLNIAQALQVLDEKKKYNKQSFLYPESGKLNRFVYKKHLRFFEAGAKHKERAIIAANRTGKSYAAAYEMSIHLNGRYPDWWVGRVFKDPIEAWCVGKTHLTTRDILQGYLLGPRYDLGSGMIPREDIYWDNKFHVTSKSAPPDSVQDVYVKHYTNDVFDGYSHLEFKSYDQGEESFMGHGIHVIHLDEEPDKRKLYGQCLTRTMTTNGMIMATFTPEYGLSEVVLSFLPGGQFPENGIIE